jgi:uncharacterized repeat protein (TIGR01451 family)
LFNRSRRRMPHFSVCVSIVRSFSAYIWCCALVFLSGSLLSLVAQSAPAVSAQEGRPTTTSLQSIDPGQGQVVPAIEANQEQGLIHIVPMGKASAAIKQTSAPAGAHLTYFGGPVISNIHVVVVFWGTHVNTAITGAGGNTSIAQFFTDITQSRYIDLLSEYSTIGINGAGSPVTSSNQMIGRGQFDGAFTIAPSLCPGTTACSLTDGQIAAELAAQINASHLPQPVSDAQGNVSSFYMIYFPAGVSISLDAVTHSCVQFCAYHSNTPANFTPKLVPYGVQPDFAPPSGCATGCGDNAALFDNVTEVTSHEMSEAITDPLVGSATTLTSPLAWFDPGPDPANPLGEIGDICLGQRATVPAGNTTYVVQQEFSNLQADCVSAPPIFTLTAPPEGAGPLLPVNVTLAVQNSANNFPLATYSGTVHFTSSDPLAFLPPDTSMAGSGGSRVFSVTFKTLGDQTIIATDTHSPGFNGTGTVNVNTIPDLTVAKTHAPAHFFIGETGATYSIVVTNSGHGPTSGTVTVTDNLPSGLTATAIGGTGWSCTLGTLTCTRADSLAATASYPAITVTVNVALNTPSPAINMVTVSGGGEANPANDTASDSALVDAPDLDVTKTHFGPINGNFFQGETGATYNISVANRGALPTNGTVTLVDTLPAGMTATDISGTGWSCTLATLTCTRSDSLAPTLAYPTITLTVNVALDAPASTLNTVTVSGGGEVNTANDLTQDLTLIVQPPVPDLAIRKSHFHPFALGGTGTYFIDVQNVGTAPTNGTITVTDTLPAGLTATSISGIAWNCVLATLTCTRTGSLQVSAPAETITVNVNVAPDAPSSVVNTATVTTAGETNLANNTSSDPTSIVTPVVDLMPTISGSGISAQGNTNTDYTVLVFNNGNIASSGTVSAVVTLSAGLTASALTGQTGWSCTLGTLTCTRSDALAGGSLFTNIIVSVNFAKDAPSNGNVSVTVSGGGDANASNNTASESIVIFPILSIIPTITSAAVNAGTPAQFAFSVDPTSNAGPATFTCSGLPAASTCSFSPSTAPVGLTTPITMTINTTARSTAILDVTGGRRPYSPLLPVLGLLAAASAAIRLRRVAQAKKPRWAFGLTALLLLAALFGCGGGGGGGGGVVQNPQGTPAGTYSVTVNAVTPNAAKSFVVTLQVK